MKKILHVIHGLSLGGAETFIYNLLSEIDNEKYKFDFVIQNPQIRHERIKSLIKDTGGHIFIITDFRSNLYQHIKDFNKVLKSHHYDYIHFHNNSLVNPFLIWSAKKRGNKIIVHSHNTRNDAGGSIGRVLHRINCALFLRDEEIIRLACGVEAGKWMHRERPFKVIWNALNLSKYYPDSEISKKVRKELGLSEDFVIGQIGRFSKVKNHKFSVELLRFLCDDNNIKNVRMIFIGEGDLYEETKRYAEKLGVRDKIIFTGGVQNPEYYLQGFDCLLLPSLYEGFAFVAVEGQAAGLPVLASDTNAPGINITDHVTFLSLEKGMSEWRDAVVTLINGNDRIEIADKLKDTKFDLRIMVKEMEEIYR